MWSCNCLRFPSAVILLNARHWKSSVFSSIRRASPLTSLLRRRAACSLALSSAHSAIVFLFVSWRSMSKLQTFFFLVTPRLRGVILCQPHLRRELMPERHWVKEQKSPVEQTCRKQTNEVTSSSHLETDPERAREKPRRSSHVTVPGIHEKGPNVCFSNTLRTVGKHIGERSGL